MRARPAQPPLLPGARVAPLGHSWTRGGASGWPARLMLLVGCRRHALKFPPLSLTRQLSLPLAPCQGHWPPPLPF